MYANIIPPFDHALGALSNILAKAEAHVAERAIKPQAVLGFRMFPDMLDFTKQVQLTCDFAARASARLAGDEPRSFEDTETTFGELQARVSATRAYVSTFSMDRYAGCAERDITIKVRGEDMTMSGQAFLTVYALPQFYFHLTTAYLVLRHNGVPLGKRDYMGG